jgi:hypothetical protein
MERLQLKTNADLVQYAIEHGINGESCRRKISQQAELAL